LAAAGTLARPYIANAAATTAEVWWAQGFVPEEDAAIKKVVADYETASGNTIDLSITPFAPQRQKIISAVTSSIVPDYFPNNPGEIIALYAGEDKFVDVSDVVETQREEYTETALLTAHCYNNVEKTAQLLRRAAFSSGITEPYLEVVGREGRLQDGGHSEDLGCIL
jgi:multiple sugar transport system substrate-binding protein